MPARIDYLDQGKGLPKTPDPVQAPLVKHAFELYATGERSLPALVEQMYELGLRNKQGKKVTQNGLATMLHNPFYMGLIRLRSTGEMFAGQHQPIISRELFNRVQAVFNGKAVEKQHRHLFLFRKQLRCAICEATLIGERQKGHIYYRCQAKGCPQKTIREELVEDAFTGVLQKLRFNEFENSYFRTEIKKLYENAQSNKETQAKTLQLQLEGLKTRLSKLADAYIDGVLDQDTYLEKKNCLVVEEQALRERLNEVESGEGRVLQRVEEVLELANNAYLSYKLAIFAERRELVKTITSNLLVENKFVVVKLNYPFQLVAEREQVTGGSPHGDEPRTLSALLSQLCEYFKKNDPEVSSASLDRMVSSHRSLAQAT